MFKAERREKIKNIVSEQKQVDVASLSKLLNVTEVTIRSDLEHLEQEGFLKRLHGGAMVNEALPDANEAPAGPAGVAIPYSAAKHQAAKAAVRLVEENDRLFLGGGETCYYLARELLRFKRLTVLTHSLLVALALGSVANISVTLTGGQVLPGRQCLAGDMLYKTTGDLFLNKAFFSVAGVDLVAGYTVAASQDADVFRAISQRSKSVALVVEAKKFDTISFVKLDDLDLFSAVACSGAVPAAYRDYYTKHDISLVFP